VDSVVGAKAVREEGATPRFPGWRVVGASFVCLTVTSGLGFYGLAAYLTVLTNEHDGRDGGEVWEVSQISGAIAVFFFVGGVFGLIVARQIARHDVRIVMVAGAVFGAIALLLLGQVTEVWHVYAVYVVLTLGHTCAGLVPAATVVTRWFQVKRSVALSIASTGLSVGGVLITPLAKWLMDRNGLEDSSKWLALLWFVGIVPVTLLFMRPDPQSMGWEPDGIRTSAGPPREFFSVALRDAVRSRFFISVTVAYMLILGAQVGGIQQLVKLVEERQGSSTATLATAVLAGTSVVARLAGGQLAARVSMAHLALGCAAVQGVALIAIAAFEAKVLLLGGIVLFGATVGNLLMLHPLLIGQEFGPRDYAQIFSRSQFVAFAGTAVGPYVLGAIRDASGGYGAAYLVAGLLSMVGAVFLPRRVRSGET
jgi:MFS family permease